MMKKMLQKKLNKKGFTLAELLIVVAILAVLVAVAIPVFSGALAEAKTAVLNADARAARGQAAIEYLLNEREDTVYYDYTVQVDGAISVVVSAKTAVVAPTQDEKTKIVTGTLAISATDVSSKP